MRVLAIIPARGGSKGFVNKNIKPFLGRPLIQWPILACLESNAIDNVFVTTDSVDIADAANQLGDIAPFLRDSDLAQDTTTTEATLKHALKQYEQSFGTFDIVVFLTCTEIFRDVIWIDKCVEGVKSGNFDSVFVGNPTFKNFWESKEDGYSRFREDMAVHGNRQEKKPNFREDTGLCCASKADFIRAGRRVGDMVDIVPNYSFPTNVDIHSEMDLSVAKLLFDLYLQYSPDVVDFYERHKL